MYVSFLQDAFSRRILGFVVAASKSVELVTRTLLQAVNVRQRSNATFVADGVIVHSDAGSQYTSLAFTEKLLDLGFAASIGRVGTADREHHRLVQNRAGASPRLRLGRPGGPRAGDHPLGGVVQPSAAPRAPRIQHTHRDRGSVHSAARFAEASRVRTESLQEPVRFTTPRPSPRAAARCDPPAAHRASRAATTAAGRDRTE
jgi:hypothetical protein